MPRCPNCGQNAARTEDWACVWCGYPLLSSSYVKIPKRYNQLQDKELHQSPADMVETGPGAVTETESKVKMELEVETAGESEPEQELEPEPDGGIETEAESEQEPKRGATVESEPVVEVTAEQLFAAYEADALAADERFSNKAIRVTGIVGKIVLNDISDNYHIALTTAEEQIFADIRCTFGREDMPELSRLKVDETVTVQGRYGGFVIGITLRECELVH